MEIWTRALGKAHFILCKEGTLSLLLPPPIKKPKKLRSNFSFPPSPPPNRRKGKISNKILSRTTSPYPYHNYHLGNGPLWGRRSWSRGVRAQPRGKKGSREEVEQVVVLASSSWYCGRVRRKGSWLKFKANQVVVLLIASRWWWIGIRWFDRLDRCLELEGIFFELGGNRLSTKIHQKAFD